MLYGCTWTSEFAAGSSFSRGKPADSVVAEMVFFFLRVCMWKEERLTIARQKNNFFLYGLERIDAEYSFAMIEHQVPPNP